MPEDKSNLDKIVERTLSSNFGISNEDLQALFADEPSQTAPVVEAPATPPAEAATPPAPVSAPAAPAPAEAPKPNPPEPPKVVEAPVSDKYEKDLAAAKDQIAGLTTLVQELVKRTQNRVEPQTASKTNPLDEITDQTIIEKPKENIVKAIKAVLGEVLPQAFQEYDTATTARQTISQFRATHSDFDEMRPIMRQVVSEDPANNDNIAALPRVYEEAKRRKLAALEAMKRELNIPEKPSTPAPPAAPQLSEEELMTKLEQRLAEKIRLRRNASGATTSTQTAAVLPADRQNPGPKEKPLTPDEQLFDDMLKAGPPSTQFLKGLDLIARK